MKLFFRAGGFHIFIGSFLTKFVAFFGSIVIIRVLSKSEYGLLSYIENLYNFAYIIAGLGLANAVLRYVVLEESLEGKRTVFDYIAKRSMCINIIIVLILCIANYFYPHSQEFENARNLMYIIIFMLPAHYFVDNELSLERALFNNKKYAYFSLVIAVLTVGYRFVGAEIDKVKGVLLAGIVTYALLAVILFCCGYEKVFKGISSSSLKKKYRKQINIYSVQYMITNGVWTLFMLLDIYMLGIMVGNAELLAVYKVAYAWPANISILCVSVGIFVAPYFVKHENDKGWIKHIFLKTAKVNMCIVTIVGITMFMFAKPLIYIYGGSTYYDAIPLMRVLLIASVINNGIRYTVANILAAMGQIKYNMLISFLGIVLQIGLNIIFISNFGVYGPAYSGICSYSLMSIILLIIFKRKYL